MKISAWIRCALILVVGGAVAFHALRVAIISVAPDSRLFDARLVWPLHPAVQADAVMSEVGATAAKGQPLASSTRAKVAAFASAAPLAVEPYLIEAARAETAGRTSEAEALLVEARTRDPRSPAARYLLANTYLQTSRVAEGLGEVAVFSRLMPAASGRFVSTLSAYARAPGAVAQLRAFFRASPEFHALVLADLAQDPANAQLILRLWRGSPRQAPPPAWQETLVQKLVEAGDYDTALTTWGSFTGMKSTSGVFNPNFQKLGAPAPFNWAFASSATGSAEPSAKGLDIIYFGREDGVLVNQIMLLPAGSYALNSDSTGDIAGVSMEWVVTCLPAKRTILRLPLKPGATGRLAVSGDCRAQRIELVARAGDVARPVAVNVRSLKLARVPS